MIIVNKDSGQFRLISSCIRVNGTISKVSRPHTVSIFVAFDLFIGMSEVFGRKDVEGYERNAPLDLFNSKKDVDPPKQVSAAFGTMGCPQARVGGRVHIGRQVAFRR